MAMDGLKTRKPTGRVPWPCILLEGEEKAGKSWALAQLSTSDRIGALYWIDLNEGAGDEYSKVHCMSILLPVVVNLSRFGRSYSSSRMRRLVSRCGWNSACSTPISPSSLAP